MDTEDIQGVNALLPQQDYPRASLMGIPLELRQRIFDFFDTSYTVFIENDGSMAFKSEMKPISHICHHLRLETFHFFIPHIILRIDSTDKRMIDVLKWLPVTIQKKIQSIHCNDMDAEIGWYNADIFPSLNEIYYHQDCVQWEVSDRHLNDTTTHDLRSAEFHYEGISEWLDCNRFLHSLHQSLDCEASDPLFVEYFWDDYDVSLDLDISVVSSYDLDNRRYLLRGLPIHRVSRSTSIECD